MENRTLRLAGQEIVDLGTVAPPQPPPALSTDPPLVMITAIAPAE